MKLYADSFLFFIKTRRQFSIIYLQRESIIAPESVSSINGPNQITMHPIHLCSIFLGLALCLTNLPDCYAQLNGSITGTTDYFWRGYSKSDSKPAAQASIDYESRSGIYLGTNISTVNFADFGFENRSNLEFRPYLGWAYKLSNDWRFNAEWTRYIYNGKVFNQKVDYNEFYISGHFRDTLTSNFFFSEDSYQQNHVGFGYEVIGRYPITNSIQISSTLGYNNQKKILEYNYLYWTAGLTWHFARNIGVDVRYYGATHTATRNYVPSSPHWGFHPHAVDDRVLFSFTVGY